MKLNKEDIESKAYDRDSGENTQAELDRIERLDDKIDAIDEVISTLEDTQASIEEYCK